MIRAFRKKFAFLHQAQSIRSTPQKAEERTRENWREKNKIKKTANRKTEDNGTEDNV